MAEPPFNASPVRFVFDPTVPLGSESLQTGPVRIRAIPTGILALLGLDPTVPDSSVLSPFRQINNPGNSFNPAGVQLEVWNDPETDLAIATKRYVDSKVAGNPFEVQAGVTDVNLYTATAETASTLEPAAGSIYLVHNASTSNTGSVSLDLGAGPLPLNWADGQQLAAGDFPSGVTVAVTSILGHYRILQYIPASLPTQASLGTVVELPIITTVGADFLTPSATAVAVPNMPSPVIIPDDGTPRLLYVDYCIFVRMDLDGEGNQVCISDGTHKWAPSFILTPEGTQATFGFTGSGISPVSYPAGPVSLTLQVALNSQTATVLRDGPGGGLITQSYMAVSMVRSH